jgi:hypothetical protein
MYSVLGVFIIIVAVAVAVVVVVVREDQLGTISFRR